MAQLNGKEILFSAKVNLIGGGDTDAAYNEGVEAGKKAEYDAFWDAFQDKGNRTYYAYGICGDGWTEANLKPKYMVRPTGSSAAQGLFYNLNHLGSVASCFDFSLIADKVDFSQATAAKDAFANSYMENIYADFSNCTELNGTFSHGNGGASINTTIKVSENCVFKNAFTYGSATTVTFTADSVIGQNGLSFTRQTNMTHEQLMSVINALKDFTGTSESRTVTLGTTNLDKLTTAEKAIATEKGWTLA